LWKICNKVIINCPTTLELRRYTTWWNINVSKTDKLQSVRVHSDFSETSESSDSDRSKWSVQQWIIFDPSLWISDLLNDVFVTGLPGLVPVYQQWSVVTFSSVRVCFGLPLPCLLSVLSVSWIFFSNLLNDLLFHFISTNSASSLREPCSLYWCKFLINALPVSLNGTLCYWYFVTV